MMKAGVLVLALLASTPGIGQAQEIEIDINAPGYTEADVMTAIDIFRRNCRPLGTDFWADVTSISASIETEYADHRLGRGWKNTLYLRLDYSNAPQRGPSTATGAGVLAGHTLHYDIGGGDTPGFLASKRSSQYLCGQKINDNGDDLFVSVPAFKFLDR